MTWILRFTQPVIVYSEPGAVLVKGEGAYPELVPQAPSPMPAPPVLPPAPVPAPEDSAPYDWPTDGPRYEARGQDRAQYWFRPPGAADSLYVFDAEAGNPLISRYKNAGIIQAGRFAGSRLWAPPDAPPALLRRIIRTGSDT